MDRVVAERPQEAALAHLVGDAVERAYRRGSQGRVDCGLEAAMTHITITEAAFEAIAWLFGVGGTLREPVQLC
jgi:hypothetical protein